MIRTDSENDERQTDRMTTKHHAKDGMTATAQTLFTLCELAGHLRVHENTARRLIAKGEFPTAFKIDRDWRIPVADVDAWISARAIG